MHEIHIRLPERPVLVNLGLVDQPRQVMNAVVNALELAIGAKRLTGTVVYATDEKDGKVITMTYGKEGLVEEAPLT